MKKNILFTLVLVLMLTACQSTKVSAPEVEPELYPLDFSANGEKTLDGYWESYFKTKDSFYLDNILAYVKAEDALLTNLNEAYKENKIDDNWVYYLEFTNTDGVLTSNYDMDALSVLVFQYVDKEVSYHMKFLYTLFPQDLLIRNVVKYSAYSSLASNADQIASVRFYLEEKLPELSLDKQNFFRQFYGITPSIKKLENSSLIRKGGFGGSTTYYFYEDGTWICVAHRRFPTNDGKVCTVEAIESKGVYTGNPTTDGIVQLTITHEHYWQQFDREINSLVNEGTTIITDVELSPISKLNPVCTKNIEIVDGKIKNAPKSNKRDGLENFDFEDDSAIDFWNDGTPLVYDKITEGQEYH